MNVWKLIYEGFDPGHEPLRETLCTLGNGYFATRGAGEETAADDTHYPGTYLAGGYSRLESTVAGRTVTNEDLVNFPNWLPLNFRPDAGEWLNLHAVELLDYRQELDMFIGTLRRIFRVRDKHGHESLVESQRLVSMANPHMAAIHYRVTPLNWSGLVHVQSHLDASVINGGVARYRELSNRHIDVLEQRALGDEGESLVVQTIQSKLRVAIAARTRITSKSDQLVVNQQFRREQDIVGREFVFEVTENHPFTVEKVVALYTSRDQAISECADDASQQIAQPGDFESLLKDHKRVWKNLWRRCDIDIDGPPDVQRTIRLHIFHLLQSVSTRSIGLDVGVPARGLHGEAYRGHVFWDELFILPVYTFQIPDITRSLLLYRYSRLGAARRLAREAGYAGAMFPWQSGSNGCEETQAIHLNPRSGEWGPDASRLQRHINAAIAYNIWHYVSVTGDLPFLHIYGAEVLLEIARFWASIATFNESSGRYEIHGVIGPDEYHERYPDNEEAGLRNNAYTNVMSVWVLERALEVLDTLRSERRKELIEKLCISDGDLERWRDITCRMKVPFHDDGIISQFEGYDALEEFDWSGYRQKYGNIERLDRILRAEGDTTDRYKVSKQADVLMLFYLLPPKELRRIFKQLGYSFDDETLARNIEYYLKRTSHGSTLSRVVHASALDRIDRSAAWELFCQALKSDISDAQGGTTPEGIHLGAMAGSVDIVLRHYAGVDTTGDTITFYPRLPEELTGLHLRLRYRKQWYFLDIDHESFRLTLDEDGEAVVQLNVCGEAYEMRPGETRDFPLTG
jgi:alpha,alpha-trehalase